MVSADDNHRLATQSCEVLDPLPIGVRKTIKEIDVLALLHESG